MTGKRKPFGYWNNKERCIESASHCNTRTEWHKAERSAYSAALKNGWLDECCAHMGGDRKPRGYWTKERCSESAKPYSTRTEWERAESAAYQAAHKKGWLDECCAHMEHIKKPNGYWTKERSIESASHYNTRTEWLVADHGAYLAAFRNGWLDDCCAHMTPSASAKLTHDDYVARVATMRPDLTVIGEYVDAKTKITHECSEGHRWGAWPGDIKRGHGCPQCMDSNSDANVVYCWEVTKAGDDVPQPMPGYHLAKFGITSQDCSQDRIKVAASRNKMQHEVLIYQHTGDYEARKYEKWLHSFGQYVVMPDRIDGRTEFRLISDAELRFIKDMLPSNEVLMPKREPDAPRSLRITAEEVRQGCMATKH